MQSNLITKNIFFTIGYCLCTGGRSQLSHSKVIILLSIQIIASELIGNSLLLKDVSGLKMRVWGINYAF